MPITPIKCAYLTGVLRKSRSHVDRHSSPLIECTPGELNWLRLDMITVTYISRRLWGIAATSKRIVVCTHNSTINHRCINKTIARKQCYLYAIIDNRGQSKWNNNIVKHFSLFAHKTDFFKALLFAWFCQILNRKIVSFHCAKYVRINVYILSIMGFFAIVRLQWMEHHQCSSLIFNIKCTLY